MSRFFAIVRDGSDWLPDDQEVGFYQSLEDADRILLSNMGDGYHVYRVERVPEEAFWEWSNRPVGAPADEPNFAYTSEQAARNSRPGGYALVKRRKGSKTWTVVPTDPGPQT